MAGYHFVTRWHIPAEPGRVWDVLNATDRYHEWWPNFVAYRPLTPDLHGVGAKAERVVKGALPYSLRYVTTTTLYDPPREVAYDSEGDLIGDGRFTLEPCDGGTSTEVTFYWDVKTNHALMNALAPILRPLFAWNHNHVMARGERGLKARLQGPSSGGSW